MMKSSSRRTVVDIPHLEQAKFIDRKNGFIRGYSVNTFHGLAKNYNQDRVSIIMNITKPNHKGKWPKCSYFGIFDGHGGSVCSDFLKQNLHKYITENHYFPQQPVEALKSGFKKAEQEFINYAEKQSPIERSGSCALVLLILDQTCYVANVGDSRAILSAGKGKSVYSISKDHKPNCETERQRIQIAGGHIYRSNIKLKNGDIIEGPFRIQPGKLSVSRSFGDIEAKLQKYQGNPKVLIAKPQITYFQINQKQHDFIMMGSDGIFDRLTNQDVIKVFWDQKEGSSNFSFIGAVASKIIQNAMSKQSMDNLTTLIILLHGEEQFIMPKKNSIVEIQKQNTEHMKENQDQNVIKIKTNKSLGTIKFKDSSILANDMNYYRKLMNKKNLHFNLNKPELECSYGQKNSYNKTGPKREQLATIMLRRKMSYNSIEPSKKQNFFRDLKDKKSTKIDKIRI